MHTISREMIADWQASHDADTANHLRRNALAWADIKQTATDFDTVNANPLCFSHEVKTGTIQAQNKTGRCWLFSALNLLRQEAIESCGLKSDFTFSVNYLYFWDKLEKANWFLEEILKCLPEVPSGERARSLLRWPSSEGGQWYQFCNLVEKYGVVPGELMPEPYAGSDSSALNEVLSLRLRLAAAELRRLWESDAGESALANCRAQTLKDVHQILCNALGTPPERFAYEYCDASGRYHCMEEQTPQEFCRHVVGVDLRDYAALIHDPRPDRSYHRCYTLKNVGNIVGAGGPLYLNLPMEEIRPLLIRQITEGRSVWFGCDCMKMMDRYKGVMADRLYDYEKLFGMPFDMDKADMLRYSQSGPNHNMTICGVNLKEGVPDRWKVENSWSAQVGKSGFYVMADSYLEKYAYQFVIHKRYLTEQMLRELEEEPIRLEAWDPIGF